MLLLCSRWRNACVVFTSPLLHVLIFSDVSMWGAVNHEALQIKCVLEQMRLHSQLSLISAENSNQLLSCCASVWEHFHTAFTLMANWSWLGRGTWPCWSLEQSTCVSKQMHKLHSYELSVTTCRLSELVGGVYNFTIPRAFQSFG